MGGNTIKTNLLSIRKSQFSLSLFSLTLFHPVLKYKGGILLIHKGSNTKNLPYKIPNAYM